ncbi:MAG TPA: GNAT family N-acetyltransferase [Methylomirabilota bacterium]|nr:GNAT family N-acetyltransferase [Methylomirabilota bacterium]
MTPITEPGDGADRDDLADLAFRRPTGADHTRIVDVIDDWWGGRRMRQILPRLWLEHFSGTSWIVERPDGRLAGFVVAFVSQDDPATGYVHMIAAEPNRRRRGLGRVLYERAFADLSGHGARQVQAVTWPGNRTSVAFHRAVGFRIEDGLGTQRLYGTPSYPDYDGPGEDRVVFIRELNGRSGAATAGTDGDPAV